MTELDNQQRLLVNNWQRKYHRLSTVFIDSLVGLTEWETILALGIARKQLEKA
ncbi:MULTISPECIES: hypothetical protein [unclassified Streptococcus]|uniref:hypothetical protein n=1 Tax=unclassified Streptococcus TaxID=2608887 RepID=UPI00211AE88D|nr:MULTISPECIES: hypothetical protein [unclassified Streptococcus]MCQ9211844.1 hypothetical protein [Streptococcus sp. B01]MCQ9212874.1 hypothetical protein [Streptococcus sp. B01]MCQ9212965.1 hypothetical protein [Streptococcus sp. O1]MCQ9214990.1 hypothetical protein [Streptococcus sp. O1]